MKYWITTDTHFGHENNENSTFDNMKSGNDEVKHINAPIYHIENNPKVGRAIALQKWIGIIDSVNTKENVFTAKLINKTNEGYDEFAEIDFDEITQEDIDLVEIGAVFYWTIGYHHNYSGQRTRISQIRLRRLPKWDDDKIKTVNDNAKKLADIIGWK